MSCGSFTGRRPRTWTRLIESRTVPKDRSTSEVVIQAGAVAVRGHGPDAQVLLVRAKRNPDHWILPKGHVEADESPADAALRELREEGAVDGEIVRPLGISTFEVGGRRTVVSYFLVRFTRTVSSPEVRERQWRSFADARRQLTFDDARQLINAAERDA